MNRRTLIKNLALGTGAALTLPTWAQGWSTESLGETSFFNLTENQILEAIAGTFIPEGKSEPGAIGLEVHKFLERLFADCYAPEDQEKIKKGLADLNIKAKNTYSKDFANGTKDQRESLLIGLEAPSSEDKEWFYHTLRQETIRGYTTSEYVMINHYNYEMAPGYYNGCVNLDSNS